MVREHQERVVAYLRLITGTVEVAEEIAQEAFLKLYHERHRIHGPDKIFPWVMITARRMGMKEMKKMRYRCEFTLAEGSLNGISPPCEGGQTTNMISEELQHILEEEINALKPRERELIALRFFTGLQIKEIADVMKLPMGSVGVYLRRALDRLRQRLERRGYKYEDL